MFMMRPASTPRTSYDCLKSRHLHVRYYLRVAMQVAFRKMTEY